MKKKAFLVLFIGLAITISASEYFFSYDFSFGFEYVTDTIGVINLFDKDYTGNGRFHAPFEAKLFVIETYFLSTPIDISLNAGISFYFEKEGIPALNISAGMSIYPYIFHNQDYFYMSFYPIYDFPVIDIKYRSNFRWAMAFEPIGYAIDIPHTPLFFGGYLRIIFALVKTWHGPNIFPDFGFTLGLHFK
jgi:hypothetical protein